MSEDTHDNTKDTLLSEAFNSESGKGREAFLVLNHLFTKNGADSFIALENKYHTLLVRTWLPATTADENVRMVAQMQDIRRKQIGLVSAQVIDPLTGQGHDIEALFDRARKQASNLSESERGSLRVMEGHYLYLSAFRKDPSLVDRYIETLADSVDEWTETLAADTPQDAWKRQQPAFEAAFAVMKEAMREPARILGQQLGRPVRLSEAALMQLNPGVTSADIEQTLAAMKPGFKDLVARIEARTQVENPQIMAPPTIPVDVQLRIFDRIKEQMLAAGGHDHASLAADGVSVQFGISNTGVCWGHRRDIVVAIETMPDNLCAGLINTWHETGHLLYLLEMNRLPADIRDLPVATFNGFGVHEAAALTMEQAGMRLKSFELMEPIIREELAKAKAEGLLAPDFDVADPALSAANLHRLANVPDAANMEWGASELSLAPNMAWRINMFKQLFDNELEVSDMPEFWAREMTEWTGIAHDPAEFMIGEDHIFSGLGGYFWAYMTGAFTATALQNQLAATGAAPDEAATDLASYTAPYYRILRDRIFQHASKDDPDELLKSTIGTSVWDKTVIDSYFERLAAADNPGMPAPDAVLAARHQIQRPTATAAAPSPDAP